MRGSLCWSMITYPFVSGNFNLSVGDISARRMERWDPNIMAASIPWERIRGIADAIDLSTAGRAEPSKEFEGINECKGGIGMGEEESKLVNALKWLYLFSYRISPSIIMQ